MLIFGRHKSLVTEFNTYC